jgi:hypothetical protein
LTKARSAFRQNTWAKLATGFVKTISTPVWPPSEIYLWGSILFTKTLLLPNPFQGRVATIRTNEAYAELRKSFKNKSYANTTTFSTYAAFMEDSALQKNKPFKIPCISMGNLSAGRHHGLLSGKKAHTGTANDCRS